MLFRKRIPKSCQYCIHGAALDENQVLCSKRGVVSMYHQCRKFRYAPWKRIPVRQKPLDFSKYDQEDYSL